MLGKAFSTLITWQDCKQNTTYQLIMETFLRGQWRDRPTPFVRSFGNKRLVQKCSNALFCSVSKKAKWVSLFWKTDLLKADNFRWLVDRDTWLTFCKSVFFAKLWFYFFVQVPPMAGKKTFLYYLALDVIAICICEIHCLALDRLNLKTVHKLCSKEKKYQQNRDFSPWLLGGK